jgi:hypothetical protein
MRWSIAFLVNAANAMDRASVKGVIQALGLPSGDIPCPSAIFGSA